MKTDLKEIQQQLEADIQIYKEILTGSLKYQLIDSIKAKENDILNALKQSVNKGEHQLSIYFVPEHIYITPFVYDGVHAQFSLEHCIDDYLYEERIFGRKQIKYTNINFKKYYENFCSKVNVNELKLLNEILNIHPSITINLKSYFEGLGLSTNIKPHEYFLALDLSF